MAEDLDVDWKTIDNHIDVLSKNGLVQEIGAFGTSRYFAMTEHGRRVLSLLLSLDSDGAADTACSVTSTEFQEVNLPPSFKSSPK
jgi:DNA-binding MarR family transcriptional regulator